METGYDIIFFWVARMIMLGLELTDDVPFRQVYLHGMVRVGGEKMSKVKGNVQDPLDLIERYGTDALRLALVVGTTPGNDTSLSEAKLEDARNFVNKLWNAARFVRAQIEAEGGGRKAEGVALDTPPALSLADRWIISRTQALISEVDALLSDFQLGEAARTIRDFIWLEYCDWYLEIAKVQLRDGADNATHQSTLGTLQDVLDATLRLLHPFAPFVTEAIWQTIRSPDDADSLMIAEWPRPAERDEAAEAEFGAARELVTAIRRLRSDYRVDWSRRVPAKIEAGRRLELYSEQAPWIATLSRLDPIEIAARLDREPQRALSVVAGGSRAYLPIEALFDVEQELARLGRERQQAATQVERTQQQLDRPAFAEKAPPEVVQRERDKLAEARHRLGLLDERLAKLQGMVDEA
jgi:valyl-tRNA synthetase